jgi:hypothetical protein
MSCQNGTFVVPNTKPNVIPSAAKDLLFTLPRRKLRLIPLEPRPPQIRLSSAPGLSRAETLQRKERA